MKCRFDDKVECPLEVMPNDPNFCRACAGIKMLGLQGKIHSMQRELLEVQKVATVVGLLGMAQPNELLRTKINLKISKLIEKWVAEE